MVLALQIWLDEVLSRADEDGEIVLIFSHVALQPGSLLPLLFPLAKSKTGRGDTLALFPGMLFAGAGGRACGLMCLPWNYNDIHPIIQKHKSVKAVFAGHDHAGKVSASIVNASFFFSFF